jgi:uncharacterized protein (DUF2236 family)
MMMTAKFKSGFASTVGETITTQKILGTERRWRRFGEPVPAGTSRKNDGSPDYGIFGPGSVVWEVLLHPATIFFHNIGQAYFQSTYKPIEAGIRDHEPMSRKAREGTLTFFDSFERASRNAGMHAPMWLGDTETARAMAAHLNRIHQKVAGDIIDRGDPGLGGYAAASPRESMWAALTEMHPMLWVYEAFAFRDGRLPHRLPAEKRDRFIAEVAEYCRLHGAPEEEIPTSMEELRSLYKKYDAFFRHSDTVVQYIDTGEVFWDVIGKSMTKNFNWSQRRPMAIIFLQYIFFKPALLGALSVRARHNRGNGPIVDVLSVLAKYLFLPVAWVMQQRPVERYFMRRMWGPDGIRLVESARALHRQALQRKVLAI